MPDRASVGLTGRWCGRIYTATPILALFVVFCLTMLPIVSLIWIAAASTSDVWSHLLKYVLPHSLRDTALLLVLVGAGTALLGAGCAWLTCMYDFPGRRVFGWALVLPLAVPTYIAAYTHVEFFDFSGPIQSAVRGIMGFQSGAEYWFPDIRSLGGAAFIFSFVLYPYVYLACRLVFAMQGSSTLDVARSLGASKTELFWRVALPMARPALAAGVSLALMETLNDIGAVEMLGVKTLTYAVFETWLNRSSLAGAVQLALMVLLIIAGLVWMERWARRQRSYASSSRERPPSLLHVSTGGQAICLLACGIPIVVGLGIPLLILGTYAMRRLDGGLSEALFSAAGNSVLISGTSAAMATIIAYGILQYARISHKGAIATVGRLASLGYAIPGTVLAVGLLVPLAGFDNWLDGLMRGYLDLSSGLLISGSMVILVYAYTLRFMAISYGTIEAGFLRLSPNIDMAARALGRSPAETAWQVHRPILYRAFSIAFLLVFVDAMKELSATLLLRPFGFETLATFIYDRASQSALEDAAIASIAIVSCGILPVLFLTNLSNAGPQNFRRRWDQQGWKASGP